MMVAIGGAIVAQLTLHVFMKRFPESRPWLNALDTMNDLAMLGVVIFVFARVAWNARVQSRQMVDRLEVTQARLAAIVDSAMDAIITVDAGQRVVLFNRAAEQLFRCPRDEAVGTPLDRFIPVRFHAAHREHLGKFKKTGATSRRMGDATVLWARRPANDEEFPIEASISHSMQDGADLFTVILRDITERRRQEEQINRQQEELQAMSARIHEAREEEKTLIARELHDELGQLLTALKMDLAWLRGRLTAGDTATAAKAGRMNDTLEQTIASVRRISANLGPLLLDDLGFSDATTWLAEDFAERFGIPCSVDMPAEPALGELDRVRLIALYRILQEALTNVARHAEARNTWIRLAIEDGTLRLDVEDDGRGITPEDMAKTRSLGIRGMRERVHHIGGALDIGQTPQGGTRVSVQVPLQPQSPGSGS
jgi:PAS domain S-box-containing protein